MAPPAAGGSRPGRALAVLAALIVALYAAIFFVAPDKVGDEKVATLQKFGARLALDLEGGTQIDLIPRVAPGEQGSITEDNINQAVSIIRQRVNSFGVSEAEVSKQGTGSNQTILISIPGSGADILQQVQQTAELRFRQVWSVAQGVPPATTSPSPSASASPPASRSATAAATPTPSASVAPGTSPAQKSAGRAVPEEDVAAGATSAVSTAAATSAVSTAAAKSAASSASAVAAAGSSSASPSPSPSANSTALPSTTPQITPQLQAQFESLDCSKPQQRAQIDNPASPLVTCGRSDGVKYILAPAALIGRDVSGATAGLTTNAQGVATGGWEVQLNFTGSGTSKFSTMTTRVWQLTPPTNEIAIVLDGLVVSAPTIQEPITGGNARITGNFSQTEATDLANVLKYGALPLAFDAGSAVEVSPTLGRQSLQGGIIAGGLGVLLVLVYMLVYYRALGLVAAASLAVAATISWGLVALLGWQIGYRLSLAGIAGLIVSVGITADSFVIFFERLRDEVRDGRTVRVAVETGWRRARRTIIVSDVVSLLAALVLYVLSTAGVRGFAFTLGLTTLVDLVVVFLFTKPLVTLFARSTSMSTGRMSGLDPQRLGAKPQAGASPSLALSRARERRLAAESAGSATSPALVSASSAASDTAASRTASEESARAGAPAGVGDTEPAERQPAGNESAERADSAGGNSARGASARGASARGNSAGADSAPGETQRAASGSAAARAALRRKRQAPGSASAGEGNPGRREG